MSAFPSLPLFTDAFLADTGHLTSHQTGAYMLLLMMAWRSPGCRIPDDDVKLARWARCDARVWRQTKPVIMEFWTLSDGYWTQKRLTSEYLTVCDRAERARLNGQYGGRPKSLKNNKPENPEGLPDKTQTKAPNPNPISNPISKPLTVTVEGETPPAGGPDLRFQILKAFEASGSPVQPDTSRAEVWIAKGYKPAIIIAVVRECLAKNKGINGLSYFEKRLAEAHAMPEAPKAVERPPIDPVLQAKAHRILVKKFFDGNWLNTWGSPPGDPGCTIPPKVIADVARELGKPWPPESGGLTDDTHAPPRVAARR